MLADMVGWRWYEYHRSNHFLVTDQDRSFLAQCPLTVCCAIFIALTLPKNLAREETPQQESKQGLAAVREIDFSGILTFMVAVTAFILFIDLGGDRLPWAHPLTISLAVVCIVATLAFIMIERSWATNPLIPLSLLKLKAGGGFCIIQFLILFGIFAVRHPHLEK